MIYISPSMLSCNFAQMGEEALAMEKSGADMLHLDIMDGHFVPNLTFGAPVIKHLRKLSNIIFDTHLMISNPYNYIEDFVNAGSDIITFHVESSSDILSTIELIKSHGVKAGLSIKPNTPWEVILPFLSVIDMVLVMTVEPGFGGQSFMADMMPKISSIKNACQDLGREDMLIQVDGGISEKTIKTAYDAGANVFVAGSALFSQPNYAVAISNLRNCILD